MKVVATILVGPGTEHLIPAAIASAEKLADMFVLIDTRTGELPQFPEMPVSTDRLGIEFWPWQNDYGAARNAALGFAAMYGATHALTLDTDERLDGLAPAALSTALEEGAECDVFLLRSSDFGYVKERVIKLSSFPEWIGPTHEELVCNKPPPVRTYTMPGYFSELDKGDASKPENQAKLQSHLDVLTRWLEQDETRTKTRWLRYMGESAYGLKRWELAFKHFWAAVQHPKGSPEEHAWCSIRAAECMNILEKPEDAIKIAMSALIRHPGFLREVGWVCSWAYLRINARAHALEWAWIGIANEPGRTRTGTVNPKSLPGCWEIVLHCARALGDDITAKQAEAEIAKHAHVF